MEGNDLDMGVVPERPNNEVLWSGVLDTGERRIHFETYYGDNE